MSLRLFFGIIFFVAISGYLPAQPVQTHRYEVEQNHADQGWIVISMKEKGLALFRDKEKYNDGKRLHEAIVLDTLLNEQWKHEFEIPNHFKLIGYEFANDLIYLLFREGEADDGDLLLATLSITTKVVEKKEIKHEFTFKMTHFWVVGSNVLLGGYVSREPAVLLYNPHENQLKVVPGFFTAETELLDLRTNQNNTFNTLVISRAIRSAKKLVLRTFDQEGVQLLEDEIEIDETKNILAGLTSSLHRDELLISGTYTLGNSKQAAGVFTVLVDPFKEQIVNYYDFPSLDHALDYMNPKRASKIRERARRDRMKGREPEFRCYASSLRLEEYQDGFLLLTELYNTSSGKDPYYQNYNPYSPYGYYPFTPYSSRYYNSPYSMYNSMVSNEVRLLSASVVSFNPEGKLYFDNSLSLGEKRKPTLEQASDFWATHDKIVIGYKNESDLFFNTRFEGNESTADTVKVMMKNPTEQVRSESKEDEGIRHWYSNRFYVWGYQSVRDPSLSTDKNRSVFYIVKLHVP